MRIHTLDQCSFEEVIDCFLEAFSDYFVKMPEDKEFYRDRWKTAGVEYGRSFGISDKGKLVGFIIHAIGDKGKGLTAFNTGTGVIPAYRGRKLVKQIYQKAIPALKARGIYRSQLEVIIQNEKAIKAYEGVGFQKVKHFHCVRGTLVDHLTEDVEVRRVSFSEIPWDSFQDLDLYSWHDQKDTLISGAFDYYLVYHEAQLLGYFIHKPDSIEIRQLESLNKTEEEWKRLLSAVRSVAPEIRMLNIDDSLTDKLTYLHKFGVPPYIEQYEMEVSF